MRDREKLYRDKVQKYLKVDEDKDLLLKKSN